MGSYQHIHFSCSHFLQGFANLLGAAKATDNAGSDSKAGKAGAQGLIMLLRQHRSRHQHGYLFAAHHGFKGRTHRHFGLAKAHIAAKQPVHGPRLFHIRFDFLQRLQLIRRFLIRKGFLKFSLPRCIRLKSKAGLLLASRI